MFVLYIDLKYILKIDLARYPRWEKIKGSHLDSMISSLIHYKQEQPVRKILQNHLYSSYSYTVLLYSFKYIYIFSIISSSSIFFIKLATIINVSRKLRANFVKCRMFFILICMWKCINISAQVFSYKSFLFH